MAMASAAAAADADDDVAFIVILSMIYKTIIRDNILYLKSEV